MIFSLFKFFVCLEALSKESYLITKVYQKSREEACLCSHSDPRRDVVNLQLALRREHAEEVPDEQGLLYDFVSFGRFKYFNRRLVSELRLNHVVQSVKVDSIVTFFHCTDIADSGKIEDALAVKANDAPLVQLEEALIFIDDYGLDFTAVQEDDTKYADHNCDNILPPVPRKKEKFNLNIDVKLGRFF